MRHIPRSVPLALLVCALSMSALAQLGPLELPKGREVIGNGQFDKATTGPVGWMTRDSGELGSFKLVPGAKPGEASVLRITCTKTCPRPWYLELRQRVGDSLQRGERLFISFEYKLSNGYAFHFYWQKETAPWPKMLSLRLAEPVGQWARVQVAVPVDEDLAAGISSLTFHLAEELGTVELRNIHAIAVSPRVDPASLPSTVEPVFGGDFYDNDWRNAALSRIAENRQSPVRVVVRDDKGPVEGAKIHLSQTARPFSVGVEVKAPVLVGGAMSAPELAPLAKQLDEGRDYLPAYRQKVLESGLFDSMTLEAALMWSAHERWGKDVARQAAEMAKARGMSVHGHALLCPAFEFLPDPIAYRQMRPEALAAQILHHVETMVKSYDGVVDRWEALFGPLTYDEVYDATGVDLLPAVCRTARVTSPKTPILLADARGLMEPTAAHVSETVELAQWLALENAKLDGLVLNARLTQPYTAPQAMDERLGIVSRELGGVPIYIASMELDVAREEAQAHMLRDLMISYFSNPAVAGVSFSSIWEAESLKPSAALYRVDMTPKPSGKMLEQLLGETWRTTVDLETELRGTAWVRAYHGTYDITVETGKTTLKGTVQVEPGGTDIAVRLANKEAPFVAKPLTVKRIPDSVQVLHKKASWQTPLDQQPPTAIEPPQPGAPLPPGLAPPMDDGDEPKPDAPKE